MDLFVLGVIFGIVFSRMCIDLVLKSEHDAPRKEKRRDDRDQV